jgi:hypothetical protein
MYKNLTLHSDRRILLLVPSSSLQGTLKILAKVPKPAPAQLQRVFVWRTYVLAIRKTRHSG